MKIRWILVFFISSVMAQAANDLSPEVYKIPLTTIDDQSTTLSEYEGRVLLIANTASQCGYTPQYDALEKLYEKFRSRGLVVLGFPSNDFHHQEPGDNQKIKLFCQEKYKVSFPLFSKAPVGGDGIQPLFAWLLKSSPSHQPVAWNFEKFVIGRDGTVRARFLSAVKPDSAEVVDAIGHALDENSPAGLRPDSSMPSGMKVKGVKSK